MLVAAGIGGEVVIWHADTGRDGWTYMCISTLNLALLFAVEIYSVAKIALVCTTVMVIMVSERGMRWVENITRSGCLSGLGGVFVVQNLVNNNAIIKMFGRVENAV